MQWFSGRLIEAAAAGGHSPVSAYAALHGIFGALLAAATLVYLFAPRGPAR
jgi:hypothetical protein